MALKVPEGPNPKTIKYSDLLGCDFSQDASLIDRRHSPNMLNMISDEGGSPVKRKGWENLLDTGKQITNMWSFSTGDKEFLILEIYEYHPYKYIYKYYDKETNQLVSIRNGEINFGEQAATLSFGFYYKGKDKEGLYIYCSKARCRIYYDMWEGLVFEEISDNVYVPKTLLSRQPSGGKAGTPYEEVNLLTRKRTESFLTKTADYDESSATTYKTQSRVNTDYPIIYKYLNSQGDWVQGTATVTMDNILTVSPAAGEPPVAGQDNVTITYTAEGRLDTSIFNAQNVAFVSQGSSEHIFLTGSSVDPQRVWWSAIGDPTYFPDNNYIELGGDGGQCMGFLPIGNELAVIKSEGNSSRSKIYLIYDKSITSTSISSSVEDGSNVTKTTQESTYAIKKISSSNGAVSKKGFAVLGDEPLFLSKQGIFGIVSTNTTEDRVVRNRSRFVDRRLLAEPNLDRAKMLVHKDYLYVFVNSHVYVFDARHKTGDTNNNTNYAYEAYYWENVPADKVVIFDDTIYFENLDELRRFKNTGRLDDYSDRSHWDSTEGKQVGGVPIHAIWSTRNDDDNAPQMFKTMMKKGTMCTLAPFERSSVYVYVIADGQKRFEIGRYYADKMGLFEEVDFDRFTFNTSEGPRDYFFRKKRKKYVRLQIFFENNEIDEGFGLYHVIKTYTEIRYAK